MNSNTRTIAGAGVIALGALVAITPRYIFPVCEHYGVRMDMGMGKSAPMSCYYTDRASLLIGIIIAVIGLAVIIANRPATLRPLALVLAVAGAATILVPTWLFPSATTLICTVIRREALARTGRPGHDDSCMVWHIVFRGYRIAF
jgi:hypothetical protein